MCNDILGYYLLNTIQKQKENAKKKKNAIKQEQSVKKVKNQNQQPPLKFEVDNNIRTLYWTTSNTDKHKTFDSAYNEIDHNDITHRVKDRIDIESLVKQFASESIYAYGNASSFVWRQDPRC